MTPFASFLPLNGFMMILANPSLGLGEGLFPQNLLNKPFFVVNGGRDPLYRRRPSSPTSGICEGGVTVDINRSPTAFTTPRGG
jgi:hypothetical protein